ncbi:hypothetical protein FTX61_02260 [Nitriliruptoraceae bacterium ZYF776]|nr:hypothetical protein [Profundirhabdus halotolerans]
MHHLELYVHDLERATAFWGWFLEELGYHPSLEWDEGCAWTLEASSIVFVQAPAGAGVLDRRSAGLNHLAFHAGGRAEVDRMTALARARGVRVLYEDRHPHAGGPDHYALFVEDPDGLKVELVATEPG